VPGLELQLLANQVQELGVGEARLNLQGDRVFVMHLEDVGAGRVGLLRAASGRSELAWLGEVGERDPFPPCSSPAEMRGSADSRFGGDLPKSHSGHPTGSRAPSSGWRSKTQNARGAVALAGHAGTFQHPINTGLQRGPQSPC